MIKYTDSAFHTLEIKADTDDLRPRLRQGVTVARQVGANKRFMDEHAPHLSSFLVDTPEQLVHHAEVLVIGHASPNVPDILGKMRQDQFVVDLVAAAKNMAMTLTYEGLCW